MVAQHPSIEQGQSLHDYCHAYYRGENLKYARDKSTAGVFYVTDDNKQYQLLAGWMDLDLPVEAVLKHTGFHDGGCQPLSHTLGYYVQGDFLSCKHKAVHLASFRHRLQFIKDCGFFTDGEHLIRRKSKHSGETLFRYETEQEIRGVFEKLFVIAERHKRDCKKEFGVVREIEIEHEKDFDNIRGHTNNLPVNHKWVAGNHSKNLKEIYLAVMRELPVIEAVHEATYIDKKLQVATFDADRFGYDAKTKTYTHAPSPDFLNSYKKKEQALAECGTGEAQRFYIRDLFARAKTTVWGSHEIKFEKKSMKEDAVGFLLAAAFLQDHMPRFRMPLIFSTSKTLNDQNIGKSHIIDQLLTLTNDDKPSRGKKGNGNGNGNGRVTYKPESSFSASQTSRDFHKEMYNETNKVIFFDNIKAPTGHPSDFFQLPSLGEIDSYLTTVSSTFSCKLTQTSTAINVSAARILGFSGNGLRPSDDFVRRCICFVVSKENLGDRTVKDDFLDKRLEDLEEAKLDVLTSFLICWKFYQEHIHGIENDVTNEAIDATYDVRLYSSFTSVIRRILPFVLWIMDKKTSSLWRHNILTAEESVKSSYQLATEIFRKRWLEEWGPKETVGAKHMLENPIVEILPSLLGGGKEPNNSIVLGRSLNKIVQLGLLTRHWMKGVSVYQLVLEPEEAPEPESHDIQEESHTESDSPPHGGGAQDERVDVDALKLDNPLRQVVERHLGRPNKQDMWLCPFHPETTPSFGLLPDGMAYKCFGCGESGDVISFTAAMTNRDPKRDFKEITQELKGDSDGHNHVMGYERHRAPSVVGGGVVVSAQPLEERQEDREEKARFFYKESCKPCTLGVRAIPYLTGRLCGIEKHIPCLIHIKKVVSFSGELEEMVFPIFREDRIVGVHRTLLAEGGTQKKMRKLLGPAKGGSIPLLLDPCVVAKTWILSEGVETSLAYWILHKRDHENDEGCQLRSGLSATFLGSVIVPDHVTKVVILQDRDEAGEKACEQLKDRMEATGKEVVILKAGDQNSRQGYDFADKLSDKQTLI